MNIVFMRHGEATDNVKEIISDKEIYWSVLTKNRESTVEKTVKELPEKIDKVYVSPLPRTIQTASIVRKKYPNIEFVVDNRIREIDHGKYSGQKNNEDLDRTREKQVAGDYFVRFGDYGENKLEIELRLSDFLKEVFASNFNNNTIMILSHGSVTSFMKIILNLKSPHIKTGKAEIFNYIDAGLVEGYCRKLKRIQKYERKKRLDIVNSLNINECLRKNISKLCKLELNNIEFSENVFLNYLDGLRTNTLIPKTTSNFDDGIILVCFYYNFANFWMEHYINVGIKNFVLIDNNSSDNSSSILELYKHKINLDLWQINEDYNCYKMCGWRQQILEHYGKSKTYLLVDSDELFAYKDYKTKKINQFIEENCLTASKSIMLDVYSKNGIEDENLNNYQYADKNTYKITNNKSYGKRYYGGFRNRVFGIRPSLQKIALINYDGSTVLINDHFLYPWVKNKNAKCNSFLIHYKFLKGDIHKYKIFAKDGRHWNSSREYKIYVDGFEKYKNFYDEKYSENIDNIINNFNLK